MTLLNLLTSAGRDFFFSLFDYGVWGLVFVCFFFSG